MPILHNMVYNKKDGSLPLLKEGIRLFEAVNSFMFYGVDRLLSDGATGDCRGAGRCPTTSTSHARPKCHKYTR